MEKPGYPKNRVRDQDPFNKQKYELDGPLIRNYNPNQFIPPDFMTKGPEPVRTKESTLKPTMNWEPVILKKKEKLAFHPEFEIHQQALKNDLAEDIFIPRYRLEQAKQDFLAEMDQLDRDPSFKRINIAFVKDGPDGDGRRAYPFHVRIDTGTILDLKRAIMNDFGYQINQ
jgi:hypothetical protein